MGGHSKAAVERQRVNQEMRANRSCLFTWRLLNAEGAVTVGFSEVILYMKNSINSS
jgi:hypothetical protein